MPALSCDTASLLAAAKCFERLPPKQQAAVQTYLLDQIRVQGGGAVMSVNELMAAAKCYGCLGGQQEQVQTMLLCQIANAG